MGGTVGHVVRGTSPPMGFASFASAACWAGRPAPRCSVAACGRCGRGMPARGGCHGRRWSCCACCVAAISARCGRSGAAGRSTATAWSRPRVSRTASVISAGGRWPVGRPRAGEKTGTASDSEAAEPPSPSHLRCLPEARHPLASLWRGRSLGPTLPRPLLRSLPPRASARGWTDRLEAGRASASERDRRGAYLQLNKW